MRDGDRRTTHEAAPSLRMPAPGGQATVVMRREPACAAAPIAGLELQRLVAGVNPLLGAASTLLALLEQLRNSSAHDDPVGLHGQLLEQVAAFEAVAGAAGVPRPKVSAARYLLCTFIDEVIARTPWGAGAPGSPPALSLLQEFHDDAWGGDKAFELLERLGEDAAANTDLLELFYLCLRLGFEGRYRDVAGGREQLDAIAARLLEVLRPAAPAALRQLSVHSQAVRNAGSGDAAVLPLWVLAALTAGLVLGLFLHVSGRLDRLSQPVFRQIHALPLALRAAPAAAEAAQPAMRPRLRLALQAEVDRGALQVRDEALRSIVTLPADALFVAGSAQIPAGQAELLRRVAAALKAVPGQIAVIGHTDDEALSSLQFPSNWHLSHERARAVLGVFARQGMPADRLRAEGRADAEPLAADGSAAGRARNRRIEIELRLPRPEG